MQHFGNGFGQGPAEPWANTAVAIVGMACRFAGARSVDEYWANLCGGGESIARYSDEERIAHPQHGKAGVPLADMECFDAALFGLSPRDAAIMDPQHRHFLECAWEALENAGHSPQRFAGAIGVFAGSGHGGYLAGNLLGHPKLLREFGLSGLRQMGNDKDFLTTRLSFLLNLKGPSIAVQAACATSLVATHMAIQSLLSNECDMALAGGVSIELPHRQGSLHEEGGTRLPDGLMQGSGVGVVVLRRLRDALESGDHIYAVIRGTAVNHDGAGKADYLAPGLDGQAHAVTEALSIADVEAGTIGYVEAHGMGDPTEIAALTQAFRKDSTEIGYCGIGSVKTTIGDTDAAAGVAGLIKVALALHHGQLPPTPEGATPDPASSLAGSPFFINRTLRSWTRFGRQPRRAGVSAHGVGGTNAHAVLEEAPRRMVGDPSRPCQLIALSARSAAALDANTAALSDHLSHHADANLADIAYTMSIGRQALKRRRVVVAHSPAEAAVALADPASSKVFTADAVADRAVAFLFCGAESQYAAMGAGLYRTEPVFRAAMNACIDRMKRIAGIDLRPVLLPSAEGQEAACAMLERPTIALPALFAVQVALGRLWMSWGARPGGMIGHSAGEYAVAHLAGVFSLEDALRVVHTRGRLFENLPEGAMLGVPMTEEALRAQLSPELAIAAIHGPELCVVSGPAAAVHRFAEALAADGIECGPVNTVTAAHSPLLDGALDPFRAVLSTVAMQPPTLPFVSNLTGDWITPAEATSPDYWVRHLRGPVRFADGLSKLLETPDQVLLEVGPGRALADFAPLQAASQPVLRSLRRPDEDVTDTAFLLHTLGRLWALGVEVNWGRYWIDERRLRLPLPTYRFERQRHWIEPAAPLSEEDTPDRLPDMADWFYEPSWQRTPLPATKAGTSAALIFEDGIGIGAMIARRLRAVGRAAILVRPGHRYCREAADRFTIDPRKPGHYAALLTALAERGRLPGQIYHLWLTTGFWQGWPSRDVERSQRRGFDSLLFLTQALAAQDFDGAVQIALVSDGMQRVCDEGVLAPAKATALGPCRAMAREYPQLRTRSIDLAVQPWSEAARVRIADALIAELASPDEAETIAYRAGERWTQSFQPAPRVGEGAIRLKHGGVYLITGGLGRPGLTLARHLAETQRARLVLIGRTAVPPRRVWEAELARLSPADPMSRRIRDLLAIEAVGGEVLTIAADVTDRSAMRRAIRQARARLGAIDGVFHAAGLLDDGPIQTKRYEAARAVIAPKLHGTLALEEALGTTQPDFILLFSSIAAIAGQGGQADYAGANAFLDAYAQARRADERMRIVSVGWSPWQDIGMAATMPDTEGGWMLPEEGLGVLERVLGGPEGAHVVVSPQPLGAAIRRLRAPRRATVLGDRMIGSDAPLPSTEAERLIAGLWSEMLGVEPVLRTDGFLDLGGDSLLAVQFANRLRKQTGQAFPLSDLLNNATVERIAAALDPNDTSLGGDASVLGFVTIRPGGTRPPLFLVHDGLGETRPYRDLAMRLDAGHPVYGIEPRRRPDGGFAHNRIDEMAADYAARIQRLRPHGPYLLAGLCAGGVIAFEVARRLQDKGETVAFVGILDAADVEASRRRWPWLARIGALLRGVCQHALQQVRARLERRGDPKSVDDMRAFSRLYELAHESHRPRGLFAGGDVALFRATAGNGAPIDTPLADLYSDCILGWGRRVADEVELVSAPGGHISLLQEPHVDTLALRLQQRLDDSLTRWASGEGVGSGGGRPALTAARPALVPAEMLR